MLIMTTREKSEKFGYYTTKTTWVATSASKGEVMSSKPFNVELSDVASALNANDPCEKVIVWSGFHAC